MKQVAVGIFAVMVSVNTMANDSDDVYTYLYGDSENPSSGWSTDQLASFNNSDLSLSSSSLDSLTNKYNSFKHENRKTIAPLDVVESSDYDSVIERVSSRSRIDSSVIRAVITAESSFDPNAVSHAGAKGLMQLMDSVSSGCNIDPFNPERNIECGTAYLSAMLSRFDSLPLALAAYNAGPGAVEEYGGIPPYDETQGYVRKIMNALSDKVTARNGRMIELASNN